MSDKAASRHQDNPTETRRWLLGIGVPGTALGLYLRTLPEIEAQVAGLAIAVIFAAVLAVGIVASAIVLAHREMRP